MCWCVLVKPPLLLLLPLCAGVCWPSTAAAAASMCWCVLVKTPLLLLLLPLCAAV
jgi:hypothetical protein